MSSVVILFYNREQIISKNIIKQVASLLKGSDMNKLFFGLVALCLLSMVGNCMGWSWVYSEYPSRSTSLLQKKKNEWLWQKTAVPGYTQLLFSWNALRPKKGYFMFWVRARDKKTRKWHSWHKAAAWGKDVQASYFNRFVRSTEYCHVRLEIPCHTEADGFCLKIEACKGASFDDFKAVTVNIACFKKFVPEVGSNGLEGLETVRIASVPKISQMKLVHPKADALCSPASLSMLVNFLMQESFDPHEVAEGVYDNGLNAYGSWPFNTAYAFDLSKGKIFFQVVRLSSFKQIHELLRKSIPVIVSVRGPLKGSATPYAHGHLLLVVGYDAKNKKVICHDPAFSEVDQVYTEYNLEDFLKAWERSKRLSYKAIWAEK